MRFKTLSLPCILCLFSVGATITWRDSEAQERNRKETAEEVAEIRQAPKRLKPSEHRIGMLIPNLSVTDLEGKRHELGDFADQKAVVVAMTGTRCPICLKYAPTLAALEKRYRDRGVAFVFVNPNESEEIDRLQQAIETHGFRGPYVRDGNKKLPGVLGAVSTTDVFILDAARTLVYRGAVDDQYGFGYSLDAPQNNYLVDALDAVLAGRQPKIAATSAPGCELFYDRDVEPPKKVAVTYHNRVSRIIQANCIECHRDGGIAPIALETYEDVKDYAAMIRNVINRKIMPPWFAAPLSEHDASSEAGAHWANDRSLSAADKADLFAWTKAGAPEGDAKEAPLKRTFPNGWLIGEPDVVFEFPRPVKVKATGTMPYKNVIVETNLSEDKWVQAIEVRPGVPGVVHHVLVFATSGRTRGRGEDSDGRSGYWGVYVPGNSKLVYPDGYAKLLPKGAKLRFQVHYTPNGTATEDSTRIGLIFAKKPPKHEVRVTGVVNTRIKIPAYAANHREEATLELPFDVQVLGFLPHMHLRAKAARYEVLTKDGSQMLLDIPRYDFNWQLLYRLAEPLPLKQGDTIRFTAWYDNSANNPANPDPTKTVRWGLQTYDEMHLGYVEYIVPGAKPGESVAGMRRAQVSGLGRDGIAGALFRRLDANGDGKVTKEEVRKRWPSNPSAAGPTFDRLDRDGNGTLDKNELSKLQNLRR
jgi:thiol-disulfide isomerase/thioredoxin/Ca2+-binding EF-hand superfamily protein